MERTFGWLNKYRQLSKEYDQLTESSEAWIHLAMTTLMLRRLATKPVIRQPLNAGGTDSNPVKPALRLEGANVEL